MYSKPDAVYTTMIKRLKEQGVNLDDKYVLVVGGYCVFNGERVSGICVSKDQRFVCIPVLDEDCYNHTDEYCYRPQCFEIENIYEGFAGNGGGMLSLAHVYVLNSIGVCS